MVNIYSKIPFENVELKNIKDLYISTDLYCSVNINVNETTHSINLSESNKIIYSNIEELIKSVFISSDNENLSLNKDIILDVTQIEGQDVLVSFNFLKDKDMDILQNNLLNFYIIEVDLINDIEISKCKEILITDKNILLSSYFNLDFKRINNDYFSNVKNTFNIKHSKKESSTISIYNNTKKLKENMEVMSENIKNVDNKTSELSLNQDGTFYSLAEINEQQIDAMAKTKNIEYNQDGSFYLSIEIIEKIKQIEEQVAKIVKHLDIK